MTSASLRPRALPCLLLLLLAFPRAASGGGMGVSAPPCGVTADSNGVNQSALPGIVWVHLRPERGAGRVEIEAAAVEQDRHLEARAAAEAA